MRINVTANDNKSVLIVEDEPQIASVMERRLRCCHRVHLVKNVSEAVQALKQIRYDLILLDIMLPDGSGLELCKRIKSDVFLRHIPVILVTGMGELEHKVNGLKLGADDYLPKPFELEELQARVEAAIRRSVMSLEANPLTMLPGNGSIEREILRRLQSGETFSVLYADINHFKAYNDYYGFLRGDQIIRKTAAILLESARGETDLVGHLGGDDFILVTGGDDLAALCKEVIRLFGDAVPLFYDEKELRAGYIITHDRMGKLSSFPLLSIAIGVVTNKVRPLHTLGAVSTIGTELKSFAKRHSGSFYAIDRRKDEYSSPQNLLHKSRKHASEHLGNQNEK